MACVRLIAATCFRARAQVNAVVHVRAVSQLVGKVGSTHFAENDSRSSWSAAYRPLSSVSGGALKPAVNPAALARHLMNVANCLDLYYSAGSDEDC